VSEREREAYRHIEAVRQKEIKTDTDIQTYRHTDIQTYRQIDTGRLTKRERARETEKQRRSSKGLVFLTET
jgi:hypothetical protein